VADAPSDASQRPVVVVVVVSAAAVCERVRLAVSAPQATNIAARIIMPRRAREAQLMHYECNGTAHCRIPPACVGGGGVVM